jgi:hypothetical protein
MRLVRAAKDAVVEGGMVEEDRGAIKGDMGVVQEDMVVGKGNSVAAVGDEGVTDDDRSAYFNGSIKFRCKINTELGHQTDPVIS